MQNLQAIDFFSTPTISPQRYLSGISAPSTPSTESFQGILTNLLGNANETEQLDQISAAELTSGNVEDLHTPMILSEQADLALRLTITVRNKVVEAYSELMRMQV